MILHFVIIFSIAHEILQIDDDEVESWVVKAITAKLIDCKIDQMNEIVIVRYRMRFPFPLLSVAAGSCDVGIYSVQFLLFPV